jgi:hypothetical protein
VKHVAVGGILVGLSLVLGAACGGDDETEPVVATEPPTAEVQITVVYPGDREESIVAAVHFWVLRLDEESEATCAKLIGGEVDPYDLSHQRLGEGVSTDTNEVLSTDGVLLGPALAHVEATDYVGQPEFAGCEEIDVTQPLTEVTITLQKANVFDCADPETEDGAPCDDGLLCTVGETCDGDQCEPAAPRDCTHVADQCNAESCDEELGCVATPLADNTPCDDGLYCTDGDVCLSGECTGTDRDCLVGADPCDMVVQCDELNDQCVLTTAPNGTACDDGSFCNGTETCSYGYCTNSTGDPCPGPDNDGDCQESCDETTDTCTANDQNYSSCDDGQYCNGTEECLSGTCTNSSGDPCTGPDGDANCQESCNESTDSCIGNDLDGSPCSDGSFCNGTESCTAGVCVSSTGDPCPGPDADDDCFETCDDIANNCLGQDPETSTCDDGDAGTSNDQCDAAGVCAGT